jgi:hypothetical protein
LEFLLQQASYAGRKSTNLQHNLSVDHAGFAKLKMTVEFAFGPHLF